MKGILIYKPTSKSAPLANFIDGLDPRLREKILLRLYFLTQLEKPEMKEPHFKRFSIERYRDLWELRVKSKVLIRIIFCTLPNGDVLLLHGFVKRQKRDTMQALEQSNSEQSGGAFHAVYYCDYKKPRTQSMGQRPRRGDCTSGQHLLRGTLYLFWNRPHGGQ